MDSLPHIFCARCGGVILGGYPDPKQIDMVIAGKNYHYYCGQKVTDEWIDNHIKELDVLLAKRRLENSIKKVNLENYLKKER